MAFAGTFVFRLQTFLWNWFHVFFFLFLFSLDAISNNSECSPAAGHRGPVH